MAPEIGATGCFQNALGLPAMVRGASIAALLISVLTAASATERPDWAFFVPSVGSAKLAESQAASSSSWAPPGSHRSYTVAELLNVLTPPDWYPDEHTPMPAIVARGIRVDNTPLLPCALCHLPNGAGHVESASLAGLPAEYLERQFADWRNGTRKIAVGNARTIAFLSALKQRYSIEQVRDASGYFASLKPRPWIRVVETASVPASGVNPQTLMRLPLPGDSKEPIGRRIVELPLDPVSLVYRDSHSGFIAYVPKGSVAAGQALTIGSGPAGLPACTTCHGLKLTGLAGVPPIAGRPPTYVVRQLWAFQSSERSGGSAAAMRLVVAQLSADQMLEIAAYLASLPPQ